MGMCVSDTLGDRYVCCTYKQTYNKVCAPVNFRNVYIVYIKFMHSRYVRLLSETCLKIIFRNFFLSIMKQLVFSFSDFSYSLLYSVPIYNLYSVHIYNLY